MNKNSKIYIAGHNGMLGSALMRYYKSKGFVNILTKSSKDLDLRNEKAVNKYLNINKPNYIFLTAATLGSIQEKINHPVKFLEDNIAITANIIKYGYLNNVNKIFFIASSNIYPNNAAQPINENAILSGTLECENEPYSLAKIIGLKLIEYYNREFNTNYISVVLPNLYGPKDNFSAEKSHVMASTIQKVYEAKNNASSIEVWGDGTNRREFLHVDDIPPALDVLDKNYHENMHINIGAGTDYSIEEITKITSDIIGFHGDVFYNVDKPVGAKKRLLDSSRINNLGWRPKIDIFTGVKSTFDWYIENVINI